MLAEQTGEEGGGGRRGNGTGDVAYACVLAVGDGEEREENDGPTPDSHALNAAVAPSCAEPEREARAPALRKMGV